MHVAMFGTGGVSDPHIKVDDNKHGLVRTGRIHFTIDPDPGGLAQVGGELFWDCSPPAPGGVGRAAT
ncbi:hypothetical protein [Actinomadura vinacea]|uniref:hypothetical protein n=1 Tax=Actinomadura vinacea TaxID=115336 RepID=UPI0031E31BF8